MFYDKIIRNRSDVNVGGKAFPKSLYPEDILSAKGRCSLCEGITFSPRREWCVSAEV